MQSAEKFDMPDGRVYEAPRLVLLPFVAFDKHRQRMVAPASALPGVNVPKLIKQFGSPLFIVSEARLRDDYRNFLKSFTRREVQTQIAYSVKTNYLPSICAIMRQEGAWAEIVSGMELDLAQSLGFPGRETLFNGPHKTREELEPAIAAGVLIIADNFAELDALEQLAKAQNRKIKIGIRSSFQYGANAWTKFGFNIDNGDAQRALERIAASRHLDLDLLHNHCGTFVLMQDLYAQSIAKLIGLARRCQALGLKPTKVDVGGGFPSANNLKPEFDVPGGSRRSGDFWSSYAEVICRPLEKAKELFGGRPTLVLEPGRAIVDGAVQLACTVLAKKKIPGQGAAIIVDAGVNLVPTAVYYDHGVSAVNGAKAASADRGLVDVFGPLCMQSDRLRAQAQLPALEVGDHLLVSDVGAYCHTQSMQFIQTRPATVLVGERGPEVIRRRETWRDVFALDSIPERLRDSACRF
jgi:diaminopimelate decarboxylase